MDNWNAGHFALSRPDHRHQNSYSTYLYNYDHFPVVEMKQASLMHGGAAVLEKNYGDGVDPKKKRLSNEQLELLENSFQEDIKLDPDRKMTLAKQLALQPRQIAVWFQNRRARWKGKQLERLYHALKHEYDTLSIDKNKLQQEVMALRAILKEYQVGKKQVSITDQISGGDQETVESTSIPSSSGGGEKHDLHHHHHQIAECSNYPAATLNMDHDYMIPPPYWATTMPLAPN